MGSEAQQLHIIFFPLMAHGHMIPMIDLAKLFASRGVKATIVLTPLNAAIYENSINQYSVQIHPLHFPSPAVTGLPEGFENTDFVTSTEESDKFFAALELLEQPFHDLVQELLPACIVSDMFLPWTTDVAHRFGLPRLFFSGGNYFSFCVWGTLTTLKPDKDIESDTEPFVVPGLPDSIELTKGQVPNPAANSASMAKIFEKIFEVDSKNHGMVVNSFLELEPSYVNHYNKVVGKKSWHVGPLSLCMTNDTEKMRKRGKKSSISTEECLNWLNKKETSSVLYVCFGSICKFAAAQLVETAAALESAGCSFIWVVKGSEVLPEGFEERTRGNGLVIRGWAPQVLILSHFSVGGFVTHCGWNSTLEGISSGVPLVTWPAFAEQFFNEKLVTQVLKVGVGVGVQRWAKWEEENGELVKKEAIEEAIRRVMGDGEEAVEMRRRAKELGEMAKKAVEEGGSSYLELGCLIEELKMISYQKGIN